MCYNTGMSSELTDAEIELQAGLDGEFDARSGMPRFGGYGGSVDLDDLDDEQRTIYEMGYDMGYDLGNDEAEDEDADY